MAPKPLSQLNRWFPPCYFDKWWWLNAVTQSACVVSNAWLGGFEGTYSNNLSGAINAGALSLNILSLYYFVIRRTLRDSREWRNGGRAEFISRVQEDAELFKDLLEDVDKLVEYHVRRRRDRDRRD